MNSRCLALVFGQLVPLTLAAGFVRAADDEPPTREVSVDAAFLQKNKRDLQISTVAKGDTYAPFITVEGSFFRGHVKTWANLRSKNGGAIASVPVEFGKMKEGDARILIFQFSKIDIADDSTLEMTVERGKERLKYVLPFKLFVPTKTFAE